MALSERKLAEQHVIVGRQIVQRQQDLIARRRQLGLDTRQSEQLLVQFERSLAIFEGDLADINQ